MRENNVKNYKNFVIHTEEGVEKGIFFRSPIQTIDFSAWTEEKKFDAWCYLSKVKKSFFRFFEILKGNSNIVNNIEKWSENDDWAGFRANILCFPIYFERRYRKLTAKSTSNDTNIQSIKSYGYESPYNTCNGNCVVEKTIITLKNGKKIKTKTPENYNFTYRFKVEKIIDSDNIIEKENENEEKVLCN